MTAMEKVLVSLLVAASIEWIERDSRSPDALIYGDLGSNLAESSRRDAVYAFLDSQEPGWDAGPAGPEDLDEEDLYNEVPLAARKMWA